jgi:hypothetical protein
VPEQKIAQEFSFEQFVANLFGSGIVAVLTVQLSLRRFYREKMVGTTARRLHAHTRITSETQVKRGRRVIHGDKELVEKLGRHDPCGSGRRLQGVLPHLRTVSSSGTITSAEVSAPTGIGSGDEHERTP